MYRGGGTSPRKRCVCRVVVKWAAGAYLRFLVLPPSLPHPYTGGFHFLTTFPSVPQPSPIWLPFQSLYCPHYCKATDDLRKKMKAID